MTEWSTDTSEILMLMPKSGQESSMYIRLSPVKTTDFMHSKWERCIVINLLIFVVVGRNNLYCLYLCKNYLWTKPASKKMIDHIKELHTSIFIGQTGCGKIHLVLGLIEKEYNKHFYYIVIICQTLRENNKTYHAKEWMKNNNKLWVIDPKGNLYQ